MNNKKLFKLVLCIFILATISCSNNTKPDEKKDWNGPTLSKGGRYNDPLAITVPSSGNIPVSIPEVVDSSVKDVAFEFISGVEIDTVTGFDKTDRPARLVPSNIVQDSFKYADSKISFSILEAQATDINERTMKLVFKVTSSTHKDYLLNVFLSFNQ